MDYCHQENIEVRHVADVTDFRDACACSATASSWPTLSREFIDSAGAPHFATARITAAESPAGVNPFHSEESDSLLSGRLRDFNICNQQGLAEMFDSSIGATTVLMPFGGKTARTKTQVSVQKIPVGNHFTNFASMMSWGFDPLPDRVESLSRCRIRRWSTPLRKLWRREQISAACASPIRNTSSGCILPNPGKTSVGASRHPEDAEKSWASPPSEAKGLP